MAETAEALLETELNPLPSLEIMSPEQTAVEIQRGLDDIRAGRVFSEKEVDAWLLREYGI